MEDRKLFRQEAIDHNKASWSGKALLIAGYSPGWIILITTLFFITMLCFIIICDYTRRINVEGEIISQINPVTLFAPQAGYISGVNVQAGDQVKKGDRLYQLDVSRVTASGSVSENSVAAITRQQQQLEDQIAKTKQSKASMLASVQAQLEQYRIANKKSAVMVADTSKGLDEMRKAMKNYETYLSLGLVNKDQMSNQRYLYYQQQSTYQNLNAQYLQEKVHITSLENDLTVRAAEFDNQITQFGYQLNELARQLSEVNAGGTIYIDAPAAGTVETAGTTEGQMVKTGDTLAQIMPQESSGYRLQLWLPNSSIPWVHPGDSINIRYEAFPFEKYGQFPGRIMSVSRVPASEQELAQSGRGAQGQNQVRQPLYKIVVQINDRLPNSQLMLANGMKAQATLFLEKRPIYQWMLSPFYDLKKSVVGPVNDSK